MLCWAGCPGCPDALHLQGQHFPAAPVATLLTGCLEQKVEPVFPSTDHHVSQEEGCWTRVWCPQIHRGISLERTSCGRKRLRLRLLTTGGEPGVYHLPSAPLCHFSLVCHCPSHTQRHLYLAQGSCDHSKLHFLPLRTHTFILVLAFPAQL